MKKKKWFSIANFRTFIIHPNGIYLACNHTQSTLWWCYQTKKQQEDKWWKIFSGVQNRRWNTSVAVCIYMFCWFVYSTDQQWDASTWVYTHFHWIKSHTSKKLPTLLTYGCHCQMISFSTIPPLCHFLTSLVLSVSFDPSFLITHLKWNIWQMLYACIVHGNDRS